MAVKNGEEFLREQILSILPQLAGDDEIIISDDHSTDRSFDVVTGINDQRIRWITNPGKGLLSNFENALRLAQGDFIFLADQDDVWNSSKVRRMKERLHIYDLAICDCEMVNEDLSPIGSSFFRHNRSGKGVLRNLVKNSYMGCCMAFRKEVLIRALPFPPGIPMHDMWIGLVGELWFNVTFIDEKLVFHRRHGSNASTSGGQSRQTIGTRVRTRWFVMKELLSMKYAG